MIKRIRMAVLRFQLGHYEQSLLACSDWIAIGDFVTEEDYEDLIYLNRKVGAIKRKLESLKHD